MGKSETSGIEIPAEIFPDDRSVCTEMSDIQSPLSVARKKMTAHMINERIAMLKKGMTPQEIVAHYEKLEGSGCGKGRKSRSKKKQQQEQPAIPEAIPEVSDVFMGSDKSVGLPPPPPFGCCGGEQHSGSSVASSTLFRKGQQSFKEMIQQRPSHFKAFQAQAASEPHRHSSARRNYQFHTVQDAPRPSHFAAFEEASHTSRSGASSIRSSGGGGKKNRANHPNGVIQTKSLQQMRTVGSAKTPHYLALEMESTKARQSKNTGMRRRSTSVIQRNDGQVEVLPDQNRTLDDTLNTLRNHFDDEHNKRRPNADLSAELSAFWAKQRKTQKATTMKKSEQYQQQQEKQMQQQLQQQQEQQQQQQQQKQKMQQKMQQLQQKMQQHRVQPHQVQQQQYQQKIQQSEQYQQQQQMQQPQQYQQPPQQPQQQKMYQQQYQQQQMQLAPKITTKPRRARSSDSGGSTTHSQTASTQLNRARSSDIGGGGGGTTNSLTASTHLNRARSSDGSGDTMDHSTALTHRRVLSDDGMQLGPPSAFLKCTERLSQSSDRMDHSTASTQRRASSDGMTASVRKMERSFTDRREPHRKMEKMLAAERKESLRKNDGDRKESSNEMERRSSGERKRSDSRKTEQRLSNGERRNGGYQVLQMRLSASKSPPPTEKRSNRTPPKSQLVTPPDSLPPPPKDGFQAPIVSNLQMADMMIEEFNESFVQNDTFENGSFKSFNTMNTHQTAASTKSEHEAKDYRLRGADFLDLPEDSRSEFNESFVQNDSVKNGSFKSFNTMNTRQTAASAKDGAKGCRLRGTDLDLLEDNESMDDSTRGAFGPVKRNAKFHAVKQSGSLVESG